MKQVLLPLSLVADLLSVSKSTVMAKVRSGSLVPTGGGSADAPLFRWRDLKDIPLVKSMSSDEWKRQKAIKPRREYTSIELFAGAGGLALGLEQAGFKHILLNEFNHDACETLRTNRPDWNVAEGDVSKLDFTGYRGKVDVVSGGFPCQAFSYAGNRAGFDDARGTLFFEFARVIKETQPRMFIGENVRGLLEHNDGKTIEVIKSVIKDLGYTLVPPEVLKAIFYRVPQKRERLLLIGVRNDLAEHFKFNWPTKAPRLYTVRDALRKGELFGCDVPESEGQKYPKRKAEILAMVPPGGYWRDLPIDIQREYMKGSFNLPGGKTGMARRLSWDEPSLTLTCAPAQNQTERCHPGESRPLTVREYARIQTFPDEWKFCGSMQSKYKQIGNAVPVNLAKAVGLRVIEALNNLEDNNVEKRERCFRFIDLFAGIGGFRLALERVGGRCVGFSEIAPDAIDTYCTNFSEPRERNLGNITKLKDLPEHDFMTAGVPCQSWSIAGKNLGFDDDRGQLWNDTLYLLNKAKPKAFIFENVKGLADPRNRDALDYIMRRIKDAGYHAEKYLLNAYDYGVPQTRVRIYIVGFREEKFARRFRLPPMRPGEVRLCDVLDGGVKQSTDGSRCGRKGRWSLSCNDKGFNNYFLFNDLRNGDTTIHSWDIQNTTARQKEICMLLLRNRRKKTFGKLDGNPLSLENFQTLDPTITQKELDGLVALGILKVEEYLFRIRMRGDVILTGQEREILEVAGDGVVSVDDLKSDRSLKAKRINVVSVMKSLADKGVAVCIETRYDFKNTKISTGLYGVNRIFLPSSDIYPTLVASDTNDYVTAVDIAAETSAEFRKRFMSEIYQARRYRQITKTEACRIQGFPDDFKLPATRARWMKLIGNSVAVSLIEQLAESVVATGVFEALNNLEDHGADCASEEAGFLKSSVKPCGRRRCPPTTQMELFSSCAIRNSESQRYIVYTLNPLSEKPPKIDSGSSDVIVGVGVDADLKRRARP